MSKRFYIVIFLTLSMAVVLLTATYSKTSGTTKYVDNKIMMDKFAVYYEDRNSFVVKKIRKIDQYKDVKSNIITIVNKNKDNTTYSLYVDCSNCLNKVYYSINNKEAKLITDNIIYSNDISGYGKKGDVDTISIRFFSLEDYDERLSLRLSEQQDNLYSHYKDNTTNNYLKYNNSVYRIVDIINGKLVAINISNVRTTYSDDNEYIEEDLVDYIINNNFSDLIKNTSFWLKDNKEYSNGMIIDANGTSYESKAIEISPYLEIEGGNGSITEPYEVNYES